MDFVTDINRVLKYGRLRTEAEWGSLAQQYIHNIDNGLGAGDTQTPGVLADFLEDEGDPRSHYVRDPSSAFGVLAHLDNEGYRAEAEHVHNGVEGQIGFHVYRPTFGDKKRPKRLVLDLGFASPGHQGRGLYRYREVTLDAAKAVADHLPDEAKSAAHEFLNRHFPS